MQPRTALRTVLAFALVLLAATGSRAQPAPAKEAPELVVQLGHSSTIGAVAFAPDGRLVLTGSSDGSARLWDAETGRELRAFRVGPGGYVHSVAFTPDGRQAVTGHHDAVRLWDVATGKEVRALAEGMRGVTRAALSPDGTRVLTAHYGDKAARVWRLDTGREEQSLLGHTRDITAVALSPDGKRVLTGSDDGTARLWDAGSGRELQSFREPIGGVRCVAFSPDGAQILTGGDHPYDGKIGLDRPPVPARLWEADTGRPVRTLQSSKWGIRAVAFSPDGRRAATCVQRVVSVWEVETGREEVRCVAPSNANPAAVAFSPDGRWLLGGAGAFSSGINRTMLWDVQTGTEVRVFDHRGKFPGRTTAALSPDGRRVLLSSGSESEFGSGNTLLWDAATGGEPRAFPGYHEGIRTTLAFSPDGGRFLNYTGRGFSVRETATGREVVALEGSQARELAVFSPDGTRVLSGGEVRGEDVRKVGTETLTLWDAATGKVLLPIKVLVYRVEAVAFSPDGTRLVAGLNDHTVRVWDAKTGAEVRTLRIPDPRPDPLIHPRVNALAVSPDGNWLLVGGDRGATLWDFRTGNLERTLVDDWAVTAVAFTREGHEFVTASANAATLLWSTATRRVVRTFVGHTSSIDSVSLSADGRRLLTASSDRTVRLWETGTGEEVCRLVASGTGLLVATPDGKYLSGRAAFPAVAFRVGTRGYPFDQFDLRFNRPDEVLKRIGLAPPAVVDAYRHAHQRRLSRMNFSEKMLADDFHLPRAVVTSEKPLTTLGRTVRVRVKADDALYPLDRLLVSVNGVPVAGAAGLDLRDKKTQQWEGEVTVELAAGRNHVQVSALNERGAESLRDGFTVTCEAAPPPPRVFAVVVGVSDYVDATRRLRYAVKDAADVAAFLEANPARFGKATVVRVLDRAATRENILKAKDVLKEAGPDDLVVVFLAGHGLLDKEFNYFYGTADVDFANPAGRGLGYPQIEGLLDGLRARRKLLLMDTCHAGEVDKEAAGPRAVAEGTVQARGFEVREVRRPGASPAPVLAEVFADLRRGTGAVVIAASGGLHFAFESPEWKNGVFTYALLRGLGSKAADRNKDGRVQVSELREHVLDEVRRLTGGRQVPTVRRDNLEFDFPLER